MKRIGEEALFFNIRLVHTGVPIQIVANRTFLQVQPLHRSVYTDSTLDAVSVEVGLEALTAEDWHDYHQTAVVPSSCPHRTPGAYAVAARKRRAEERALNTVSATLPVADPQ